MTELAAIVWWTADAAAAAADLAALGFRVDRGGRARTQRVDLGVVDLELRERGERVTAGDRGADAPVRVLDVPAPLLEPADHAGGWRTRSAPPHPNGCVGLIAVGWATVDAARATRDIASPSLPGDRDEWLGASTRVVDADPVALVLLEPDTEGKLAAWLARRGEGPAALYLAIDAREGSAPRHESRRTPFGAARLLPLARRDAPFLLLVDAASPRPDLASER